MTSLLPSVAASLGLLVVSACAQTATVSSVDDPPPPASGRSTSEKPSVAQNRSASENTVCEPSDVSACEEQCKAGNAESCFHASLARLKWADPNVQPSPETQRQGAELAERGCSLGHGKSCAVAASVLGSGEGKSRVAKAHELATRGCELGEAQLCTLSALIESDKLGVTDLPRALASFQRGCELGDAAGCVGAARLYFNPDGPKHDETQAVALASKACEKDPYATPCWTVLQGYLLGADGFPRAPERIADTVLRFCEDGKQGLCTVAGGMARVGEGRKKDLKEARLLFEKGCDDRGSAGCALLGDMLARGEGGEKDVARARQLWDLSCPIDKAGPVAGCFWVAQRYEKGDGVKRDAAKARALYQRMADGMNRLEARLVGQQQALEKLVKDPGKDGDTKRYEERLCRDYGVRSRCLEPVNAK
ncbi:MAG: sel1 repeat family protein [Polyangiaceae bacterium]|nr:sel1 repeat family protein [Polyangiaceae bacterium]